VRAMVVLCTGDGYELAEGDEFPMLLSDFVQPTENNVYTEIWIQSGRLGKIESSWRFPNFWGIKTAAPL